MSIGANDLLVDVAAKWPRLAQYLKKLETAVTTTAQNAGVSHAGNLAAPTAPSSVSVSTPTAGEMLHVSITDNAPIQKGQRYFTEISTDPYFTAPLVIDHGASRTSHPIPLPTNTGAGMAHNYYVRSYSQLPGSPPSVPAVYGGDNPIAVQMTGTTKMDLLPSTGSGTAAGNGQQPGQGLGVNQFRLPESAKRSV